ncbi:MAG: PLDc N-terminal domain-containing protein, partial [Phycisphaerales bacterium]|nr:PLDc N-terminal domain-containing protein [Phycisphaerales bacterium]
MPPRASEDDHDLAYLATMNDAYWTSLLFLGEFIVKVIMIFVVLLQRKKTPSAKLSWILLIVALPFVGTAIYLLIGTTRLGSLRRKRHREILKLIPTGITAHVPGAIHTVTCIPPVYQSIASIAEAVGASCVIGNNNAQLFGDSDKMIDSLASDIEKSTSHCHLLSYIMLDDHAGKKIAKVLSQATTR